MSDLQKTFDKVARHLLTQKERAVDVDGACMYRAPGGLKCAVGCLIPDELYEPDFENKVADALSFINPALRQVPEINGFDEELRELQKIHDLHEVGVWPTHLAAFALRCHLSVDVLKEFA